MYNIIQFALVGLTPIVVEEGLRKSVPDKLYIIHTKNEANYKFEVDAKKLTTIKREISALIRDGYNIEVREYNKSEIHDRYLINHKNMFLIGTSLNYIGKKDTFIVKVGNDMRETVSAVFYRRWRVAKNILKSA